MELICPLCGEALEKREKQLVCPRGHSFDIARQGYVNLLTVQQKHSLDPGDTREQVLSRRAFLDTGLYRPIARPLLMPPRGIMPRGNCWTWAAARAITAPPCPRPWGFR